MQLRATIGGRNGGDFTRTVDINSQKDFSKVERAAAAWARQELRAMPTFGSPRRTACHLLIEWVEPPSPPAGRAQKLYAQEEVTLTGRGRVLSRKLAALPSRTAPGRGQNTRRAGQIAEQLARAKRAKMKGKK